MEVPFKVWYSRLRAVSLLLKNPLRECDMQGGKPQAASSTGVGRQAKRETAMVLYRNLES